MNEYEIQSLIVYNLTSHKSEEYIQLKHTILQVI